MAAQDGISPKRMMYSAACFIQASGLLAAFFIPLTNQDSWLPTVAATLLSVPLAIVYGRLIELYPGKSLVGMLREAFGNIAGKIISAAYVYFFFILTLLNTNDQSDLIKSSIYDKTPKFVITVLFVALCAWAMRHGSEVLTGYAGLFSTASFIIMIIATIFLFNLMDFENFLPILRKEPFAYAHATGVIVPVIFGESIALLMLAPLINQTKGIKKYLSAGFLIGGGWLLLTLFVDISVLGNTLPFFIQPAFETLKMVRAAEFINRIDVLFATMFVILLLFKVSVLFYAFTAALGELFGIKHFKPLIYPLAIIVAVLSMNIFESSIIHGAVSRTVLTLLWIVLTIIIPLITLIVASLKSSRLGAAE
jgi:spore germination protein KB